jgi:superfamily II DNA or RNA helicase/HKD family nuclease
MSLRDIPYRDDYRSGYDDLVEDFFRPSLREARGYWRAVGYFSSSALESFGAPLGDFVLNNGHIRLVTSVELSETDLRAIEAGTSKQEVCAKRLEEIIDEEFSDGVGPGVVRLARLLELNRLDIKIAVPKSGTGIYHEKIGIFFDENDFVAFTGSSNESRSAFDSNRECIDAYPSWQSPRRAHRKLDHFEQLWAGLDRGVDIWTFPEAAERKLLQIYRSHRPVSPKIPDDRWRHQDEALERFIASERGVLNMATGTGKTRTALRIIETLFNRGAITSAIVTMDGTDLLNQWHIELLSLRHKLPQSVRLIQDFDERKQVQEFNLDPRAAILLVSRRAGTTRDPLASSLRRLSGSAGFKTLLIHDEVHRLGSPGNRERLRGLSQHVRYRLGLSATPEREYDNEGNEFIEEHIGPVLFTFGLDDAIRRGVLSPFSYFPLPYELNDDDRERLRDVYRLRAARAAAGEPMSDEEVWIELAKVYKTSTAKLPVFDDFIKVHRDFLQRCIIFVETQEYGYQVLDLVHKYRADFHTYFSGEQSDTLRRFAYGDLECLVTCHRLSEGIDIKSLNTVILFSSTRARLETIQRMGRCLRIDPNHPAKVANVVDFVRGGDEDDGPNADIVRSVWLSKLAELRPEELSDGP